VSKTHVIFDLDDTLYPERLHAHSGFRAAGRHAETAWGITGLADDMIRMLDEGHLGALFKLSVAARIPDHTDEHIEALREAYRNHEPEIELFDDGRWALDHYGAIAALGLITDGNAEVQSRKIAALNIAHHFDAVVLTGALGAPREFHKPHPMAYELIERKIGAPGDHYVYVGDNPAKDFVTPNARGWTSIQVLREKTIHDQSAVVEGGAPQHQVRSLRELPDFIKI
jgi:putative hydrolase of the HAD superfamily